MPGLKYGLFSPVAVRALLLMIGDVPWWRFPVSCPPLSFSAGVQKAERTIGGGVLRTSRHETRPAASGRKQTLNNKQLCDETLLKHIFCNSTPVERP